MQLKDGVETEIAAASRESKGKRGARAKAGQGSAAKLAAGQAKYSRFEAEVGRGARLLRLIVRIHMCARCG